MNGSERDVTIRISSNPLALRSETSFPRFVFRRRQRRRQRQRQRQRQQQQQQQQQRQRPPQGHEVIAQRDMALA